MLREQSRELITCVEAEPVSDHVIDSVRTSFQVIHLCGPRDQIADNLVDCLLCGLCLPGAQAKLQARLPGLRFASILERGQQEVLVSEPRLSLFEGRVVDDLLCGGGDDQSAESVAQCFGSLALCARTVTNMSNSRMLDERTP